VARLKIILVVLDSKTIIWLVDETAGCVFERITVGKETAAAVRCTERGNGDC